MAFRAPFGEPLLYPGAHLLEEGIAVQRGGDQTQVVFLGKPHKPLSGAFAPGQDDGRKVAGHGDRQRVPLVLRGHEQGAPLRVGEHVAQQVSDITAGQLLVFIYKIPYGPVSGDFPWRHGSSIVLLRHSSIGKNQRLGYDGAMDMHIIAQTPYYLVVDKPSGLPTVPLKQDPESKDTLLGRLSQTYPEIMGFGKNPWEGGVLHRLDTLTRGLVLVARDQNSYAMLCKQQEAGLVVKDYLAVSSVKRAQLPVGFPPFPYGDIADGQEHLVGSWFRAYGEKGSVVRPVDKDAPKQWKSKTSGVWYETRVKLIDEREGVRSFACQLASGFRHQIRCHLAWAGYPLDGDASYRGLKDKPFGLTAVGISFLHPVSQKPVHYTLQ